MDYLIASHTDVGIRKSTNQDAYLVKVAQTILGKACLCVMCDGMGGLSKGELASATVIDSFSRWFERDFPRLLRAGFQEEELNRQWNRLVLEDNQRLSNYAAQNGIRMGTTVVALLLLDGHYYILNVGDSRAYMIDDRLQGLTKDHTYVQAELDLGHITYEQSLNHPQRNMLLQCVGASDVLRPDFYSAGIAPDQVYMLCTDGFRHVITPQELYDSFNPSILRSEAFMEEQAVNIVELNKSRREQDNISVVLIRTCQEG